MKESSEQEEESEVTIFDEQKVRDIIKSEMAIRPRFEVELEKNKNALFKMVKKELMTVNFLKINELPDVVGGMTRMKDNTDLAIQQVTENKLAIDIFSESINNIMSKVNRVRSDADKILEKVGESRLLIKQDL